MTLTVSLFFSLLIVTFMLMSEAGNRKMSTYIMGLLLFGLALPLGLSIIIMGVVAVFNVLSSISISLNG